MLVGVISFPSGEKRVGKVLFTCVYSLPFNKHKHIKQERSINRKLCTRSCYYLKFTILNV